MSSDRYHSLAVAGLELARQLVAKAQKPKARETVSVLTYPAPDLDGDFVRPDGGQWVDRPFVNWNHDIPVGTGRVVMKALEDKGVTHILPVGFSRFAERASDLVGVNRAKRDPDTYKQIGTYTVDECLRAAADVYELVADEVATGVSIEFRPAGKVGDSHWPVDRKSEVSGRQSFHFEKWNGLGWAHAPEPINRSAAVVINDLPAGVEKALRIAQTGQFPGGRHITEIVRKAFDPLLALPRKVVAVGGWDGGRMNQPEPPPVVEKAMDEPVPTDATAAVPDPAASGLKPTPRAIMTVVQGIYDLCQQAETLLSGPDLEHESGMKLLRSAIDKMKAEAGKVHDKAAGMFPDAGLAKPDAEPSDDGDELEDDAPEAVEGDEDEDEPVDYPEMTADGAVVTKAFPSGIPGIQRFKLSQLKDIPVKPSVSGDDAVDPEVAALLRKTNADLAKLLKRDRKLAATLTALL